MVLPEHGSFYVGGWRVSPDEDTVSRDGRSERLEPLAMQVLVYLASHAGEVVSRSDLERAVGHPGAVGYDPVASSVTELREALGDAAGNPRYIAPVPKHGYRLIAAVSAEPFAPPKYEPSARQRAPALSDRAKVALLLLVLAVIAALVWALLARLTPPARQPTSESLARLPTIVVLPYKKLSNDPLQDHLAGGMTDDLVNDLSEIAASRSKKIWPNPRFTP